VAGRHGGVTLGSRDGLIEAGETGGRELALVRQGAATGEQILQRQFGRLGRPAMPSTMPERKTELPCPAAWTTEPLEGLHQILAGVLAQPRAWRPRLEVRAAQGGAQAARGPRLR
jgi:hypothetical protein